MRAVAAQNPNTPGHVLEALATDTDSRVRAATAARTVGVPAGRLERWFATDPTCRVRVAVAAPDPTLRMIRRWAMNPDGPRRTDEGTCWFPYAAAGPSVWQTDRPPVAVLEQLATDPEPHVRAAVAANPNTPPHVLDRLVTDPEAGVRAAVATNPSASAATLVELSYMTRVASARLEAVASNPATPRFVLDRMIGHHASEGLYLRVAAAAVANLKTRGG